MPHHPDTNRLALAFAKCRAYSTSWSGELYRTSSLRYANKDDLLSGAGSKSAGARWNAPNRFRAVYTSLDPHTAIDEALAHFLYYGFPIAQTMPRVIVSLQAHLRHVLDMTDRHVRRLLGVSEGRLLHEPWREKQKKGREAMTQATGRLTFPADWEGIRVPSA